MPLCKRKIKPKQQQQNPHNKPTLIIFNIYKTPFNYDWNWNMKPALHQLIASALGIVPLFHARAFNNLIVFVSLNIPSGASQPSFYFFWWFCTCS